VVACRRSRIRFARPPSIDDVAGVVVPCFARVEEPFFSRCASRVGGALRRSICMHRGLAPLRTPIAPRVPLLADAGRRAFGLLDGRLLDECLASRCRFRASGVEGAGMARSSVATAMSFWLARGGVSGLSTLKLALMRSRACMPSYRARSPRAEASPAIEARSNRTV
jgi:hypothetical protein